MRKLSKKEVSTFLKKAYRFFKDKRNQLLFKKLPKEKSRSKKKHRLVTVMGKYDCDGYNETISVDYRYEIVPSIIHETLHALHEKWTEKKVYKEEKRYLKSLTQKQALNLLRCFLDNLR